MDISEHLCAALKMRKKTQKALAEQLDISCVYVNQLCKGIKKPSMEMLERICGALELTPSEFFSCAPGASSVRLDKNEVELVIHYRALYDYEREAVAGLVRSLGEKHAQD